MVFSGMILLTLICGYWLRRMNRLGSLEMVAIAFFVICIADLYIGSVGDVLDLVEMGKGEFFFAFRWSHGILLPLTMLIFMNLLQMISRFWGKMILMLLWTALLVSGESILEQVGLFRYVNYPLTLSISFWLAILTLTMIFGFFFQKVLSRSNPHV